MTIREMIEADIERAVAINQANLADVDSVGEDELAAILGSSRMALAAEGPEKALAGFAVVVDRSCRLLTTRAAWALANPVTDLHLERVTFDMQYSGLGLGPALFGELDERLLALAAASNADRLTLTSLVRRDPPNEHAIHFHEAKGFAVVDQRAFGETVLDLTAKSYPS
ncbi:MAG: hypothetical protein F4Z00_00485 [Acidimicrobiaceae bacterium]|nr:hypothetical protein [Acidimicrobiaceae bacterium]MXZ64020.1 hypothetical protein [Acidimicrobiaceae bacterium]MYF31918.1 hypothetical protein [Acidimicrobiaceae bacterium]MYG77011.1 hypothetical protein [Acidimicrobiaceae bacterium]MYJ30408.1 hypothetical protein [Acidimicrobiaceae bacterium]